MLAASILGYWGPTSVRRNQHRTALNKLRLLVDDNAAMRGIVRTVLSAFGCMHVFEASSAKQAMDVLRVTSLSI
jgi:hypothetical protein